MTDSALRAAKCQLLFVYFNADRLTLATNMQTDFYELAEVLGVPVPIQKTE